jgi:hypothetical protein
MYQCTGVQVWRSRSPEVDLEELFLERMAEKTDFGKL